MSYTYFCDQTTHFTALSTVSLVRLTVGTAISYEIISMVGSGSSTRFNG